MKKRATALVTLLLLLLVSSLFPVAAKESFSLTKKGSEWVPSDDAQVQVESPQKQQQTEEFPATYDLRNVDGKNYVTPVRNQGALGTCWAHSALACVETNALLKGASENIDLSEKALAWYTYQFQGPTEAPYADYEGLESGEFKIGNMPEGFDFLTNFYNNGGTENKYCGQMTTWLGASTEAQIPYFNSNGDLMEYKGSIIPSNLGDWSLEYSDIYDNAYHLHDVERIMRDYNPEDPLDYVPEVKELMLKNGAMWFTYHAISRGTPSEYYNEETFAQYTPPEATGDANHAVTLVGWDDNFPKSKFTITPPGDGAWIIKNSWGTDFAEEGFFYVSYYDAKINEIDSLDAEVAELGYSYDNNYQYDYTADKASFTEPMLEQWIKKEGESLSEKTYAFANVFTAVENEELKAVSITSQLDNCQATAEVYLLEDGFTSPVDGKLVGTVNETFPHMGFHTVELSEPVMLSPGQKFSVVEKTTYPIVNQETGESYPISFVNFEYGLQEPIASELIDESGQTTGVATQDVKVVVKEGESYVCGVAGDNVWTDITDPETYDALSIDLSLTEDGVENNYVRPGNCMIKAYTKNYDPNTVEATGITFEEGPQYLTTIENGTTTAKITPTVEPSGYTGNVSYSITPASVATVRNLDGSAYITAVSEGRAQLRAQTDNGYVATKDIIVSDKAATVGNVLIDTVSQDYLTLELKDVQANPALAQAAGINNVSVFVWSQDDMGDLQPVLASQTPGTNDWVTPHIGINDTTYYLQNADQIKYVVYVTVDGRPLQDMVFSGFTSWVEPGVEDEGNVSFIAYGQNVGFVQPTVHIGYSGMIDDPYSTHIEGLRVSSGIPGAAVTTSVCATGLGWLDPVQDGQYAGTMGEDRPLEAIKLDLDDSTANYLIRYRVYVTGSEWTDWVAGGGVAGTEGGQPIQAVQIEILQGN